MVSYQTIQSLRVFGMILLGGLGLSCQSESKSTPSPVGVSQTPVTVTHTDQTQFQNTVQHNAAPAAATITPTALPEVPDGIPVEPERSVNPTPVVVPKTPADVAPKPPSPIPKPEIPKGYRAKKPAPFQWVRAEGSNVGILATEVTVAQFFACVAAGACKTDTLTPTSPMGPTCNYGRAGYDEHPMNCVNYFGAEQLCTFAKGRVCTDTEWLAACAGPENRPFPYGTEFELSRCNMHSETTHAARVVDRPLETAPVKSFQKCTGGIKGLWDMSGNVNEWVNGCKGTYCKFLGGGYFGNDPVHHFNSCSGVCAGNQKEFSSATIGIRCCRDMD